MHGVLAAVQGWANTLGGELAAGSLLHWPGVAVIPRVLPAPGVDNFPLFQPRLLSFWFLGSRELWGRGPYLRIRGNLAVTEKVPGELSYLLLQHRSRFPALPHCPAAISLALAENEPSSAEATFWKRMGDISRQGNIKQIDILLPTPQV